MATAQKRKRRRRRSSRSRGLVLAQTKCLRYRGYRCRKRNEKIAEVSITISPEAFYRDYIAKRRPCILRGLAFSTDLGLVSDCAGSVRKWCSALKESAGEASVRVEKRKENGRGFGRGSNKDKVKVKTLIAHLQHAAKSESDADFYLTTQPLAEDDEGRPEICSEPCSSLLLQKKRAPPLVPKLIASLIPANINIWMGCGQKKSHTNSSGLHHDFHDNLLILISGEKCFRVWDPTVTPHTKPSGGQPLRVFPNGRIVYKTTPTVQDDGRDLLSDRAQAISTQLDCTHDEDELDQLLDAALDAETGFDSLAPIPNEPTNFATIPRSKPNFDSVYPDLRSIPSLAAFTLRPGDALYLPCGFWHEVTSAGGIHAAWNYWFHPPTTPHFSRPYASSFWPADWARRCRGDDPLVSRAAANKTKAETCSPATYSS